MIAIDSSVRTNVKIDYNSKCIQTKLYLTQFCFQEEYLSDESDEDQDGTIGIDFFFEMHDVSAY